MASNNLDLIIDVIVTRDTPALSQQDFNASLFVTDEQVFPDRYKVYTSASEVLTEGFSANSATYKAVRSFFSQGGNSKEITVGRRDADVIDLTVKAAAVENDTAYTLTVQGVDFVYTSDSDATDAEITAGLQALIAADTTVSAETVATDATGTLTLTEQSGYDTTLAFDPDVFDIDYTTQEDWPTALTAITDERPEGYLIMTYDHTVAGGLAIAAVVESLPYFYLVSGSHVDNLLAVPTLSTPSADNLREQLARLNYDRTAFIYSGTADETYLEMGWAGERSWTRPGESTWGLSSVKGVIADGLTRGQINATIDGGGNVFINIGGIPFVKDGQCASGEWIDTIRGGDNMASDAQIALVRALATEVKKGKKIALTNQGMGKLKGVVALICENYVDRNFLKDTVEEPDGIGGFTTRRGYDIFIPKVSTLTTQEKQKRQAPDIQVTADLAGAVNSATLRINLYV